MIILRLENGLVSQQVIKGTSWIYWS